MKYYVSFSGGADSTALALYLLDQGHEVELVFSDTGAELPETYWFIPQAARKMGVPLTVLSNGTYFQWLVNYNFIIPGVLSRWCTRVLKQYPQSHFYADSEIPVAVGITADESHRLSGEKKSGYEIVRPLVDGGVTKKEARKRCEKAGVLNPVYQWTNTCSCAWCHFSSLYHWRELMARHPNIYAMVEDWEREAFARAAQMGHEGHTFNTRARCKQTGKMLTLEELRQRKDSELHLFNEEHELQACLICRW